MIVNGRWQFIGSRRTEADAAIEQALALPAVVSVEVNARAAEGRREVHVDYHVSGCPRTCEITVALVQDHAETTVLRGENARRVLKHRHVVRSLSTRVLRADGPGTIVAEWRDAKSEPAEVVTFVSDADSGAVLGARAVLLHDASATGARAIE
jgi:hypothetical protein